jgi:hypothetical protein
MNWWMQLGNMIVSPLFSFIQKSPAQGAFGVVQVAIEPSLTDNQYNGKYFFHGYVAPLPEVAKDKEVGDKLWAVSEKLTGVKWQ